jgi:hypothetical protein
VAEKKVYLGSQGPYLFDDSDILDDPDGDFSGQAQIGIVSNSQIVATEFVGIPISSISVTDIDDPSTELNPLSASTVGGLIAVYQAVGAANDEFTMYLWDTNAAVENVPYTVDGTGGVWIAVSGKYQNGDLNIGGSFTIGSPVAHITDANVAHATASFADVNTALDALGGKINLIIAALENAGLAATS